MKFISHKSAEASHYDKESESYDAFNEKTSGIINQTIEKILKKHQVKTVLDLSCGTGSQVFWLTKRGFDVTGCDINAKMLKIAKDKAKNSKLAIKFIKGDMRKTKAGKYDAAITIFNAIGHLTKEDFSKAIGNIRDNLNDGGLYVFDIFNLDYLRKDNNITQLTIDFQEVVSDTIYREIQYSTIDRDGILASYDTYIEQKGAERPILSKATQTLQVYTAKEIEDMLSKFGFNILRQCNIDGSRFYENKSERILTVAKKA